MRRTLVNVQALRAVAASLVVLVHIGGPGGLEHELFGSMTWLGWVDNLGVSGVDLFFVISGFIMLITTHRVEGGTEGARRFLWRRATRIYPPYVVITAIFVLFVARPSIVNPSHDGDPGIIASFLLLPQDALPLLLVGWTLTYELYFYLVFAAGMLAPRRALPWILAMWGVVMVGLSFVDTDNSWLEVAQNPINLEFLLGVAIGYAYIHGALRLGSVVGVLGAAALTGCCVWAHLVDRMLGDGQYLRVATLGVPMAAIVYGAVALERADRFTAPRWLQSVGDSSYSLYLTHVLTIAVANLALVRVWPNSTALQPVALLLAFIGCVVGGLIFYRTVEQPIIEWFRRRSDRQKASGRTS